MMLCFNSETLLLKLFFLIFIPSVFSIHYKYYSQIAYRLAILYVTFNIKKVDLNK